MNDFVWPYRRWWVIPVIWLFCFLALDSARLDSPTMDEQNHIGRGVAFVKTADPRLSLEHPPLTNAISALPLLTMPNLSVPFDHPSWQREPPDVYWYHFAEELLWRSGNDVTQMLLLARLPVIGLTLGLALVGFHFARQLWGRPSASLAFVLLLFDPNLLAHGRYVTTDMGGALFALLATLLLWRLWQKPGWDGPRWAWAGVGMGLAFGSKLSMLLFVPIWGVLALLPLWPRNSRSGNGRAAARRLFQLGTAGLLSIGVVWAIFGFEWRPFLFQTEPLQALNAFSGPMPTFWAGIEKILLLSGGGRGAYLNGAYSVEGFTAYFPVAFAVKTPLPTLLALATAIIWLAAARKWRPLALLLTPALLYFAAGMLSALNIGYRHLLPLLPFVYLLIAGLAVRRGWTRWLGWGTAVALLAATLWIHPHYLSFFNQAAGGPAAGHRYLLDSNIDWGQDLLRLQQWMAENDVDQVQLGWFGTADPAYYDLSNTPLPGFPRPEYLSRWTIPPFDPAAPAPGVYAISVSNLMELPLPDSGVYAWFRQREPDARIGYSIWIYDLR